MKHRKLTGRESQGFDHEERGPYTSERPSAYDEGVYPWSMRRVPTTLQVGSETITHPAKTCGVFVVHGIGEQAWTETAVGLRSGFEDALAAIGKWQAANPDSEQPDTGKGSTLPPPFLWEGYWANYENIEKTFKEDWNKFESREQEFFSRLWQLRTHSAMRTVFWFVKQQLRLLSPSVRNEVGFAAWMLYIPLQIVSLATLLFALVRYRSIITGFLEDIRLYLEPVGMVERAIVQRIDYRVGEAYLRMIGIGWDFRSLKDDECIKASGETIRFDRIVWVAHSLGTVISFNVLSDLFRRALRFRNSDDKEQRQNAERFLDSLHRFVTLGSPLDKVAFLFPNALRPWPPEPRRALLQAGEKTKDDQGTSEREWWINFYHVLDPVSGALSSPVLFDKEPPANFHIKFWYLPGWAHVAYWRDQETLRFILGRTFGRAFLRDKEYRPMSPILTWLVSVVSYFVYASFLVFAALLIARLAIHWFNVAMEYVTPYLG